MNILWKDEYSVLVTFAERGQQISMVFCERTLEQARSIWASFATMHESGIVPLLQLDLDHDTCATPAGDLVSETVHQLIPFEGKYPRG